MNSQSRGEREYSFPLFWLLLSVVILSLLPEKKNRYLMPILISACYLMGYMINRWTYCFRNKNDLTALERVSYRINALLLGFVILLLPVAAYMFLYAKGFISVTALILISLFFVVIAIFILISGFKLIPRQMVAGVVILFLFAEIFCFPMVKRMIDAPDRYSISNTKEVEQLEGLPFYYKSDDEMRIEIVYAAGRKIRPMNIADTTALRVALPCALVTHQRVEKLLPQEFLNSVKSSYIGKYCDVRRATDSKERHNLMTYNVTILSPKNQ